ncbi:GNAT family N-acetyltransferase [Halolamina salifodinae]|uniref:Ribosomal-protein-alanine N-acetyltransferase n=1 Tax=Halolamina salifodinae TaxID=1202767 RepID=A0A8T4GUB6_9EURY|nr:GNAT family N-acetyltransferase [Halolamina salifodinae]MBP1985673.1 ribosomal-protein-alanine N-acetyltransferase [Halolamina salifodinae]
MIRDARPADRAAISRLQQRLPEPAPELLDPTAGGELLVSTADGAVVGYLLWFPGDPTYAAEVVVHPDYRREGRGRALFEEMFDRTPEGTAIELRVAAENEGAQRLYDELGFERVAVEPDAYDFGAGYRLRAVVDGD